MSTHAPVPGLHHVTAITGNPQPLHAFMTRTLGQRMVKRTVNFDDPGTWHLYYGDGTGRPGTIMTHFPYPGAATGSQGSGQASAVAYAVPRGALEGWRERLAEAGHAVKLSERFGDPVLALEDPHGQPMELVAIDAAGTELAGFHSVTLWVDDPAPTARVLSDLFGYEAAGSETGSEGTRLRLSAPGGATGSVVDILHQDGAPRARPGAGTIHHVAFRASDDAMQDAIREAVQAAGHRVTPQIDRQYFHSIYFREPGGILFEVATDPPGFTVDEPEAELGTSLQLPPQHEHLRARIVAALPPLDSA